MESEPSNKRQNNMIFYIDLKVFLLRKKKLEMKFWANVESSYRFLALEPAEMHEASNTRSARPVSSR